MINTIAIRQGFLKGFDEVAVIEGEMDYALEWQGYFFMVHGEPKGNSLTITEITEDEYISLMNRAYYHVVKNTE